MYWNLLNSIIHKNIVWVVIDQNLSLHGLGKIGFITFLDHKVASQACFTLRLLSCLDWFKRLDWDLGDLSP